jgi:uroporphyrinogen decarboxylase
MGRERIARLLRGEEVDRPAVAAWRHFPQDDQDAAELAESTVRFQREYDWDLVKVTPAQSYLAELWGAQAVYSGDAMGVREFTRRPVGSFGDWRSLAEPDQRKWTEVLGRYVEAVGRVKEAVGADGVVLATIFTPLSIARYLAGEELFLASVRMVPEDVQRFLGFAAEVVEALIGRVVGAGADGCFVSLFSAGSGTFGEAEYRSVAGETDRRVFTAAQGGWFNIAHFHSPYPLLRLAGEYGVEAVSWDCHAGGPSLREVSRLCPDQVLVGGVDQRGWLVTAQAAEVRERARSLFGASGTGAGSSVRLVVAPGCTVSQATPFGNLRALRHSVDVEPASGEAR